jgi:acyl-CoA ligase (AMP-forming) (exosortase A-associated)
MSELLPELIFNAAARSPNAPALSYAGEALTYEALAQRVRAAARGLIEAGIGRSERVGIYLEKRLETVIAMFAAAAAGAVFVPINPLLRARQVGHILRDCNVRIFVTSADRLNGLELDFKEFHDVRSVVLVDQQADGWRNPSCPAMTWAQLMAQGEKSEAQPHRVIDVDMVSILYTSGSTGLPKGVVLSHRNMLAGAKSVSSYLKNTPDDRILSVLPLSFDAGFSQLSTAFNVGACTVLMNYLLPQDVMKAVVREKITGLACVPPLWIQLAQLDMSSAAKTLRYCTNTGGRMPRATLDKLREGLPNSQIFLMYGLTEAFRSTYLDPKELDRRPDSIGKAIPNAEILVVRPNGELCAPNEPGELVHRGALVALGYWNDPEKTKERFKPVPNQLGGLVIPELAVWSGDTVRMDEEGFLYFVSRRDEMIKTSGYRVSPTEVEEAIYATGLVGEVVAFGAPHPVLGEAIVVIATPPSSGTLDPDAVIREMKLKVPPYMVPHKIVARDALPRNPNGKMDRKQLSTEIGNLFPGAAA